MRYKELLKLHGFEKRSDGKWINPSTGRGMRPDLAKDKAAKLEGFDSYKQLQNISRTSHYKKFSEWFKSVGEGKSQTQFNNLYAYYKKQNLLKEAGKKYDKEAYTKLLQQTSFNPQVTKDYWIELYRMQDTKL